MELHPAWGWWVLFGAPAEGIAVPGPRVTIPGWVQWHPWFFFGDCCDTHEGKRACGGGVPPAVKCSGCSSIWEMRGEPKSEMLSLPLLGAVCVLP